MLRPFFSVQQVAGKDYVMNIGRGGFDAVDQYRCVVGPNVYLHAEVPQGNAEF